MARGQEFTLLEIHALKEWAGKLPAHEIALRLGMDKRRVDDKMRHMKLSYRVKNPNWMNDKTIPIGFVEVNGKIEPVKDGKSSPNGIPRNINYLFYRGKR